MIVRCHKIYRDELGRRCLCRLRDQHLGACLGHVTSEDLVPPNAIRRTITFQDRSIELRLWESEIEGVWLVYAPPPDDLMTQSKPGEGTDGAVEMMQECLQLTVEWETEQNAS
jgi:predicted RNase H-like HicB family nuclease